MMETNAMEYVKEQIATNAEFDYVRKSISIGIDQLVLHGGIHKISDVMRYLTTTDCVCTYCKKPAHRVVSGINTLSRDGLSFITDDNIHLNIDHIIPKSKFGANHYLNYVPACVKCNRMKGAVDYTEPAEIVIIGRLFSAVRSQLKYLGIYEECYHIVRSRICSIARQVDGVITIREFHRILGFIKGSFPYLNIEQVIIDTDVRLIPKYRLPAFLQEY